MNSEVWILILEAMAVYFLVLWAHSLRHRFGMAHFYALIGGITAVMSWITDAGVKVQVAGITFMVGSTVFYTSLLLGVFVVYVFDGPRATRIAISTVAGVSIMVPLIALVLHLQMKISGHPLLSYIPVPDLRINASSVFATVLDLVFLAIAWEYLGKPKLEIRLCLRAFLTLLGVMWLDVLLFATGAFAGSPEYLNIMKGTLFSRLVISVFAFPLLYLYLSWQNRKKGIVIEHRPVLAILKEVAEVRLELNLAQREIERRMQAEEALRQSEEKFSLAFRTSPYAIAITRLEDGRFIEVNDAFTSIMGFTWEEVASSSPVSLMLWVNEADRKQVVSTLLDGGTVAGREFSFRKKNGEIIDGLLSARIIHLNQGPCILSSIDDITLRKRSEAERLRLEQRIRQAEKAASLGRMAGAIAHHFNNLLGAVMGNLELTKAVLPPDSKADEFIAQAMQASRRAAGISRSMLATLGQAVGTKAPIRLTEICREALPALAASLPEGVCLKIDLPDEGPTILADAVQIRQVLSNLVVNAGEAVGDREGDVTVAVGVMPAADLRGSRFHPPDWEPTEEDYVCLSVSDTGVGMDAETMEKAFDPFFTTKFTGRGLGLAVLLGVVKGHEGAVMVESTPGSGSVFRVLLPVCIE